MSNFTKLVVACEDAWKAIAEEYPDVPENVIVLVGSGGRRAKTLYGHFAPERWESEGSLAHEILLVAEQLARGGKDIFTTILHEACHGIANSRGVRDVSGRRHNKKFRNICEEVGLDPPEVPDRSLGWSSATLSESLEWQFKKEIDAISEALTMVRLISSEKETKKTSWKAVCQCDRIIRVGPKMYNEEEPDKELAIVCTLCGGGFEVDE